jgi:ketosteroid isomerase-like protein
MKQAETLRAFERAFNARDLDSLLALMAPDAEWHPVLGALLSRPVYRGRQAVCEMILEEIPSLIEGFRADLTEVHDLGAGTLIADVRFFGTGRASGVPLDQRFFQLYRVGADGRLASMHTFSTEAAAREAAGSSG